MVQNRICLVTDANSGIGKATALNPAERGCRVVMVCRDTGRAREQALKSASKTTCPTRKEARFHRLADDGIRAQA